MIQAAVQVPPEAGVTVVAAVVVEVRVGVGVRVRGMIDHSTSYVLSRCNR